MHGCGQASREASPAVLLKTPQQLCFSDVSSAPRVGMPTQCDVSYLSSPLEDTSSACLSWSDTNKHHRSVGSAQDWLCHVVHVSKVFSFFVLMGWLLFSSPKEIVRTELVKKHFPVKFSRIRCQCLNFSFPRWIHLEVVQQPVLLTFLLDATQLTTALKWQLWVSAVGLALSNLFSVAKYQWIVSNNPCGIQTICLILFLNCTCLAAWPQGFILGFLNWLEWKMYLTSRYINCLML